MMIKGSVLRHGVKSWTFKLARNFCLSASKYPPLAIIYPGKLTQTTSMTASKTSMIRRPKDGCDSWLSMATKVYTLDAGSDRKLLMRYEVGVEVDQPIIVVEIVDGFRIRGEI